MDDVFKTALQKIMPGRFKQKELAEKVNISVSYFNDLYKGRKNGQESVRRAIAAALGYEDYESFLDVGRRELGLKILRADRAGPSSNPAPENDFFRVPFLEYPFLEVCSDNSATGREGGPALIQGPSPGRDGARPLQAFKVEDNHMEPLIAEGGIVLVDLGQNILSELRDGGIYLVHLGSEGQNLVRRLKWVDKDRLLAVESEKGSSETIYKRNAEVRLLGRVIWSWREHV